jgi:hypothetical protein
VSETEPYCAACGHMAAYSDHGSRACGHCGCRCAVFEERESFGAFLRRTSREVRAGESGHLACGAPFDPCKLGDGEENCAAVKARARSEPAVVNRVTVGLRAMDL